MTFNILSDTSNPILDQFRKDMENQAISYAVGKQMWCNQCKGVLDEKKTTVLTVRNGKEVLFMRCICDTCMTQKGKYTREYMQKAIDYETCKTFYQLKGIRVANSFEHWQD
jgi:hypothetical protein